MRKKGNTVLAGLIICLLFVFLAAAGKLFSVYLKYQKGEASYEKLQEYVQEPEEEESPEPEKEKEEPQSRYLEIDFAGLKAVNPDVIAWIQIPALDISYPVVQGKDNAYYLHHLFSGESNINGSIFVDCHNQPDFTDQNTIVYGHNMKTGACSELWISTKTKRYLNSIRSFIFTCRERFSSIVSFPAMREEPEVRDIGIISRKRKIFRYFWIRCLLMGIMIPAPSCRQRIG